ncbi:hypothetical protein C5688_19270 [Methylocystis sp. MitZ-2018]|nr:hypothetical protein C5688_19270 [Methylocystis sp. MitZ-2018]
MRPFLLQQFQNWEDAGNCGRKKIVSKLTEFLGISRENAATIAEGAEEVRTATEFLTSISEKLTQILDGAKSAAVAMPLLGDIITKSLP